MKSVYWFDDIFNADKPYKIPNRETTIEELERMLSREEDIESEPNTIIDILRKQSEVT